MPSFDFLDSNYTDAPVVIAATVVKGQFVAFAETDGFYAAAKTFVTGDTNLATVITKCKKVKAVKNAGEVWIVGDALYWDDADDNVTVTAGALSLIGYAIEAAASAAVIGYMDFDGSSRFKKA